jgi:hypothetical protein
MSLCRDLKSDRRSSIFYFIQDSSVNLVSVLVISYEFVFGVRYECSLPININEEEKPCQVIIEKWKVWFSVGS